MKTLYLECAMGAAGDMLTAALLELLEPAQQREFLDQMNALGLPGVEVRARRAETCGIGGTRVEVLVNGAMEGCGEPVGHDHGEHTHGEPAHHHEPVGHDHGEHLHGEPTHHHEPGGHDHHHAHHHAALADIDALIGSLALPEPVRRDALAVYKLIAGAESHAHGRPVEQIHFHEVGTADAVADVVGCCLLMHRLAPGRVVASPVHVGCGQVRCAHGLLPVPAPATAYILREVPIYGGAVQGELCTPTGAALLKYFAAEFGDMPLMRVQKIGYGLGKKTFAQANCVRAMLGETGDGGDRVTELCCNLDDMTPEAVAFAAERLLAAGALDVYTTAIGMKKSRPGVLLTCLCRPQDRAAMVGLLFRHTTTLGVREQLCSRCTLRRSERVEQTPYGPVRVKTAEGWGVRREKAEYEDLAAIARARDLPLGDCLPGGRR